MNVDCKKIIDFLYECYLEMDFSKNGLSFDKESVKSTIENASINGYIEIVKDKEEILGIFAAMVVPNIMNYEEKRAIEYIWHTKPSLNKLTRIRLMINLLKNAMEWQESKNIYLVVNASEFKPFTKKILSTEGFKALETSYGRSPKHGS